MYSINKYSSKDISIWSKTNIISLHIKIHNNILSYNNINHNGYFDRGESILELIKETLLHHKINDVEIFVNLMDNPQNNPYFLAFSRTSTCPINTVPNFSFYQWKVANLLNFFDIKKDILNNNVEWDKKIDKIMWSGTNSSDIRDKLNSFKNDNMYEYNISSETNKFYKLTDHSDYKYLLDLEGIGYSGRFPYLALTSSCVIVLQSSDPKKDYKLYYDNDFKEDVHYLRVIYDPNEEISNINQKIFDKIKNSDCKKIGEECQKFAIDYFTKDKILLYWANILNYYASHYEDSDNIYNPNLFYSITYITDRIKKRLIGKR